MEAAVLKSDLLDKIEHADDEQITKLYGLVTNYLNSQVEIEEWDSLPALHKQLINKGLEQAEMGLGTPLAEVNRRIKEKYGLNG
ncbi:hypothetical protein [Mucilaginibacter pedocola]|uniref:Uncharacterized protein n=1 Tax=Mucilaginibacter pedocola TaxID=1792845 RepID=A0A1S9PA46_9SPHI|nr:hypothetical protein [Mucilaginibacter pedocola]OOQ57458.1 hypothetical protein BC343_15295 [Mucilaginibacter pedocola]